MVFRRKNNVKPADVESVEKNVQEVDKPKQNSPKISKLQRLLVLSSRLLLAVHTMLTVWRLFLILNPLLFYISIWVATYILDAYVVIRFRNGIEWTWVQPIIFFYLMVEVPSLWLLVLDHVSMKQEQYNLSPILKDVYEQINAMDNRMIFSSPIPLSNGTTNSSGGASEVPEMPDNIDDTLWMIILTQTMVLFIILIRWIMPKGEMTLEEFSSLMLTYLGMSSDVVDMFGMLDSPDALLINNTFVLTILSAWSWSMFQFIFNTTVTKNVDDTPIMTWNRTKQIKQNARNAGAQSCVSKWGKSMAASFGKMQTFVESEMWGIFVALLMQDGPFFVIRMLCIFRWSYIGNFTTYFYTIKNFLIIIFQLYRLVGVYKDHNKQKWEDQNKHVKSISDDSGDESIYQLEASSNIGSYKPGQDSKQKAESISEQEVSDNTPVTTELHQEQNEQQRGKESPLVVDTKVADDYLSIKQPELHKEPKVAEDFVGKKTN